MVLLLHVPEFVESAGHMLRGFGKIIFFCDSWFEKDIKGMANVQHLLNENLQKRWKLIISDHLNMILSWNHCEIFVFMPAVDPVPDKY